MATDLLGVSARAMIEALIAGERDPTILADLARGQLKAKRAALLEALDLVRQLQALGHTVTLAPAA